MASILLVYIYLAKELFKDITMPQYTSHFRFKKPWFITTSWFRSLYRNHKPIHCYLWWSVFWRL